MNKLNMFLLDDCTKVNANSSKISISGLKIKDNVLSISPSGIENKTIKTTVINDSITHIKKIELISKDCLYPSVDNKLFVSTEDNYDTYKVVVLCSGKYQKIVYGKCPTLLFSSLHPEADRIYIIYASDNEELAKFTAEYFINNANITKEQYEEAKKIVKVDGYSDHSFLQQYDIDENYPDYDKTNLPMYICLTTNYKSEKEHSVLIVMNNYEKFAKETEDLIEEVLNVVPYKEIDYYKNSCEITFSSSNYEFIYNVAKAVKNFSIKNIHPKTTLYERLYVENEDSAKTYKKLPVSNICIGMALPVLIENEIISFEVKSNNDYNDISASTFQKGKGLEIEDTHLYLINDIVVPDNN